MPPGAGDPEFDATLSDRVAATFSQLQRSDFELLDPPDDLWDRIAASVAVGPEHRPIGSGAVVEYAIDAHDVVFTVGDNWAECARTNDAPELVDLPPARTLWSYIDGDEVRDLWRALVREVRAKQLPATVPIRCDSHEARRWFEMTLTPAAEGVVHIRGLLVFEQPRTPVPFLDRRAARADDVPAVPFCSWCARVHDGSTWEEIEVAARRLRLLEDRTPPITSGICPTCRDLMSADALVTEEGTRAPR